jgi:hypothetical protein
MVRRAARISAGRLQSGPRSMPHNLGQRAMIFCDMSPSCTRTELPVTVVTLAAAGIDPCTRDRE